MKRPVAILAVFLLIALPAGSSADHIAPIETTITDAELADVANAVMRLEGLVVSQEVLLNVYRCELGRDTQLVPGGCPATLPAGYQIPVYLCGPEGTYNDESLQWVVGTLNWSVTAFFARQSSGLASVTFTAGQVVSPSGVDWSEETVAGVSRRFYRGDREVSDCYGAAWKHSETQLVLIFVPNGGGTAGTAGFGGPAWVAMDANGGWGHDQILVTVAHELGHALWDWPHTNLNNTCLYDWSLMDSGYGCHPFHPLDYETPLAIFEVVCWQRTMAGWPCD